MADPAPGDRVVAFKTETTEEWFGFLAEPPSGGASISGIAVAITQTAHGLSVGNVVRLSGSSYVKAQANNATNAEVVGMVSAVPDADHFTLIPEGHITGLSSLSAGTPYFLSPTTAGALTATEPTTAGQVSKPVLIADSATSGYVVTLRGLVVSSGGGGASFPVSETDGSGITYSVDDDTFTQQTEMAATLGIYSGKVIAHTDGSGEATAALVAQAGTDYGDFSIQSYTGGGSFLHATLGALSFNILAYAGDPNTIVSGNQGDLLVDPSTPALWINTTGSTTWVAL